MMPRLAPILTSALFLASSALSTKVPSLSVPACPSHGTIHYNNLVPNRTHDFPPTQVDLCYTDTNIHLRFTAYNETNFYYNSSYTTNDPVYEYEVMEAFVARTESDPRTYLEVEVAPNNVTFNAFIYNPSRNRSDSAPFDTLYLQTPVEDGLIANTTLDRPGHKWTSDLKIPLGLFNVEHGHAKGTKWRMNFFRTVVDPKTFPAQTLGAWSPPDEANFHITKFFGRIAFV